MNEYNQEQIATEIAELLNSDRFLDALIGKTGGAQSGGSLVVKSNGRQISAIAVGEVPPGDCVALKDTKTGQWYAVSSYGEGKSDEYLIRYRRWRQPEDDLYPVIVSYLMTETVEGNKDNFDWVGGNKPSRKVLNIRVPDQIPENELFPIRYVVNLGRKYTLYGTNRRDDNYSRFDWDSEDKPYTQVIFVENNEKIELIFNEWDNHFTGDMYLGHGVAATSLLRNPVEETSEIFIDSDITYNFANIDPIVSFEFERKTFTFQSIILNKGVPETYNIIFKIVGKNSSQQSEGKGYYFISEDYNFRLQQFTINGGMGEVEFTNSLGSYKYTKKITGIDQDLTPNPSYPLLQGYYLYPSNNLMTIEELIDSNLKIYINKDGYFKQIQKYKITQQIVAPAGGIFSPPEEQVKVPFRFNADITEDRIIFVKKDDTIIDFDSSDFFCYKSANSFQGKGLGTHTLIINPCYVIGVRNTLNMAYLIGKKVLIGKTETVDNKAKYYRMRGVINAVDVIKILSDEHNDVTHFELRINYTITEVKKVLNDYFYNFMTEGSIYSFICGAGGLGYSYGFTPQTAFNLYYVPNGFPVQYSVLFKQNLGVYNFSYLNPANQPWKGTSYLYNGKRIYSAFPYTFHNYNYANGKFYGVLGFNQQKGEAYIDTWKRKNNGEVVWDKIIEVPFYKLKLNKDEVVRLQSYSYYPI
jgi:hypothetical protein